MLSKIPAYEYLKQESASALGAAEGTDLPVVFVPMEGGWQLGLQTEPLDDASSQSSSRARRTRIPGRSFSFPRTSFALPASSWSPRSTA